MKSSVIINVSKSFRVKIKMYSQNPSRVVLLNKLIKDESSVTETLNNCAPVEDVERAKQVVEKLMNCSIAIDERLVAAEQDIEKREAEHKQAEQQTSDLYHSMNTENKKYKNLLSEYNTMYAVFQKQSGQYEAADAEVVQKEHEVPEIEEEQRQVMQTSDQREVPQCDLDRDKQQLQEKRGKKRKRQGEAAEAQAKETPAEHELENEQLAKLARQILYVSNECNVLKQLYEEKTKECTAKRAKHEQALKTAEKAAEVDDEVLRTNEKRLAVLDETLERDLAYYQLTDPETMVVQGVTAVATSPDIPGR